MGRWSERAAELEGRQFSEACARDASHARGLPRHAVVGLADLHGRSAPAGLIHPERWPTIVADAERLAAGRWAVTAICLGWTLRDLFGCAPPGIREPDMDGLAAWLDGRRLIVMDEARAVASHPATGAVSHFRRPDQPGATLLWEFANEAAAYRRAAARRDR